MFLQMNTIWKKNGLIWEVLGEASNVLFIVYFTGQTYTQV